MKVGFIAGLMYQAALVEICQYVFCCLLHLKTSVLKVDDGQKIIYRRCGFSPHSTQHLTFHCSDRRLV